MGRESWAGPRLWGLRPAVHWRNRLMLTILAPSLRASHVLWVSRARVIFLAWVIILPGPEVIAEDPVLPQGLTFPDGGIIFAPLAHNWLNLLQRVEYSTKLKSGLPFATRVASSTPAHHPSSRGTSCA